ncbi:MAG TPA: ABC transporter ATP-binding protein, partial [Nocardioides sp.]
QTVILSSHILAEVQEICDRVGVIDNGRLLRESTVADLRGGATLRVRATPEDAALAALMRMAGDEGVRRIGNETLEVDLPVTAAPDVVRQLVAHSIDVHEVTVAERSLEDVFFEMTSNKELVS